MVRFNLGRSEGGSTLMKSKIILSILSSKIKGKIHLDQASVHDELCACGFISTVPPRCPILVALLKPAKE